MKYLVVEPFTIGTSQGTVTLPAGKLLALSQDQAARLAGKVELILPPNGGRDLSHFCEPGSCWCSAKLPSKNFPAGCIRINCKHHLGTGDHLQGYERGGKILKMMTLTASGPFPHARNIIFRFSYNTKTLLAKELLQMKDKNSNAGRTIIFKTKANRFETVEVSHEVYLKTPLVSVRRYRGDNFTGKGISLQPDHFEKLLPEIVKAIQSLRLELADNTKAAVVNVAPDMTKRGRKQGGRKDGKLSGLEPAEIDRQVDARIVAINADNTLTPQQREDALKEVGEWAYKESEYLLFDED